MLFRYAIRLSKLYEMKFNECIREMYVFKSKKKVILHENLKFKSNNEYIFRPVRNDLALL